MKYKNPITRYEDIVDYYKSIKSLENLTFARVKAGMFNQKEAFETLKEKRKNIEKQYSKILNPDDRYLFKNIENLESFLSDCGHFSKKEIKKNLQHEMEHYNEALKQGLSPSGFLCWLCKDEDGLEYVISTQVEINYLLDSKIYQKISHAPSEPSYIDLMATSK